MSGVAVLGPGGVGGFIAAALARAGHEVTVLARAETAAAIKRDGLRVRSVRLGDFEVRPRVAEALAEPVDVLVVATKATSLAPALERIEAAPRLVVPMLNGLDHIALLRERFGEGAVAAATIRIESDRPSPGVIVQTSGFLRVDLAGERPGLAAPIAAFAADLEGAGVPARVEQSEAQILWSKLVRLNALALTTSAYDVPIGEIRSDPERRGELAGCIWEAAAVANADGAKIEPEARLAELDEAHAGLGSSMQRDIAAGRIPELDAIAGAVLRAGARHGVPCPTVVRLAARVAQRAGIDPPKA